MIRINLLQLKRKKKPKPLPSAVTVGVLLAVITVMVWSVIILSLGRRIDGLKATKKANEAKIAELKRKVKEVDDFEAKIKIFEERKGIIEGLRKNQTVPVRVLNELSFLLADGVWLKSMEIKASNIDIKGYAFTNSNVVEFVNNLKKSELFNEVYLVESKEASVEAMNIYAFALKFKLTI